MAPPGYPGLLDHGVLYNGQHLRPYEVIDRVDNLEQQLKKYTILTEMDGQSDKQITIENLAILNSNEANIKVEMEGLTGMVNFNTEGFRTNFELGIVELRKEGLVQVTLLHNLCLLVLNT